MILRRAPHSLLTAVAVLALISFADRAMAQTRRAAAPGTAAAASSINYSVSANTTSENFEVSATLNNIVGDTIIFHFPIWGPGAYDIVNFGAYVNNFTATSSTGKALKVIRGDTNTFRIVGADSKVKISYKVDDVESAPNSLWFGLSDIEKDYAFANTPAIFGYPAGYKDIRYSVKYEVPRGWDIAIGLDPAKEKGTYNARDYDELVDAPLAMGKFQRLEFEVKGKPHVIAIFAEKKLDAAASKDLVDATRKIITTISDFFNGDMPYDRYIFQHYLVSPALGDAMFGALEHRNSSTYRMPVFDFSDVTTMLSPVIAHEYWHTWSPKRIHVAELGPFDYQRAPRTNSLWFAEGITEYYAQVLLARNGMGSKRGIVSWLNQMIESFHGKKQKQSIAELSMKVAEVAPSEIITLYTKGPALAMLFDLSIRTQTNNTKSLDDAMRYFNEEYGKKGKTFTDEEIIPIIERATGAKLGDFYTRYITGDQPLPFAEYLPAAGLKISTEYEDKKTLGAMLDDSEKGWMIAEVTPGGSADLMKMRAGDVITELITKRSAISTLEMPVAYAGTLATMRDVTGFTIVRDGAAMKVDANIVTGKVAKMRVEIDPQPSAEAAAMRKEMFGF
jgi:predicted metalloprotease with PDZ domain